MPPSYEINATKVQGLTPLKPSLLYIFKHKYFILELILLENLVCRQALVAESLVELILNTEDYMLFSARKSMPKKIHPLSGGQWMDGRNYFIFLLPVVFVLILQYGFYLL